MATIPRVAGAGTGSTPDTITRLGRAMESGGAGPKWGWWGVEMVGEELPREQEKF